MADSKFFVALPGDSPLSDRFAMMFETLTIPIILDATFPEIYERLPFKHIVPWKELFITVSVNAFKLDPIQS
eukprot:scaffold474383_cov46-Prasinocladus_malaysianus.AAC.1